MVSRCSTSIRRSLPATICDPQGPIPPGSRPIRDSIASAALAPFWLTPRRSVFITSIIVDTSGHVSKTFPRGPTRPDGRYFVTKNLWRAMKYLRRATKNLRHAPDYLRRVPEHLPRETEDLRSTTKNLRPASENLRRVPEHLPRVTENLRPAPKNLRNAQKNLRPVTQYPADDRHQDRAFPRVD